MSKTAIAIASIPLLKILIRWRKQRERQRHERRMERLRREEQQVINGEK